MQVALFAIPGLISCFFLTSACSGDTGTGPTTAGGRSSGGAPAGSGGTSSSGGTNNGGSSGPNGGSRTMTGGSSASTGGASPTGGAGAGGGATAGGTSGGATLGGRATAGASSGGVSIGGISSAGANNGASGNGGGSISAGGTATSGGAGNGGSGGSTSTGGSGGQVDLPPGVTGLFPAPNGTNLCPDPPLRIKFGGVPTLGTSGKIQVFNSSGTVVASVDMAATGNVTDTIGGDTFNMPRPTFVDGNDAVIYLKSKSLAYGQTYYVTVDSGAVVPPGGGTLSITGNMAWRFTTAAAAPSNLSNLTVALDGAGQYCTVQGAADALPANNTAAARINVNSGIYHEIIRVKSKSNITLHGQDRKQTIIRGINNDKLNPGTAPRALVFFDNTPGLVIENLTIHNTTPQDGSQAEALRLRCDKCVVRDADIRSLQDTLLWDGRVYANNCYIEGNVDYIWGSGVVYFNKCEIRTVGRTGVIVQSRNAAGAYGYVFVDSKITADSVSTNNILARIDVSSYPESHVAYVNCQLTNVAAAGWTVTGGMPTSALRFWEYQSTDAAGNPIDTSGRVAGTQISADQAAMMRDPNVVFNGWIPPN
jgi:hypothetical protein